MKSVSPLQCFLYQTGYKLWKRSVLSLHAARLPRLHAPYGAYMMIAKRFRDQFYHCTV